MGLGSYTYATVTAKGKNKAEILRKIYEYANDASEGIFYSRVFGIPDDKELTEEEEYDLQDRAGVTSLCQAECSAKYDKWGNLIITVYSVYDTPLGVWEEIAKQFPTVQITGEVVREEDESMQGFFIFIDGKLDHYDEPTYIEDEEEEDEE